jgi:hypothetical protein
LDGSIFFWISIFILEGDFGDVYIIPPFSPGVVGFIGDGVGNLDKLIAIRIPYYYFRKNPGNSGNVCVKQRVVVFEK